MMRSQSLLALVLVYLSLSLSLSSPASGARKSTIVGGWSPIKDVSDPQVQSIAKFAVDEHNKAAPPGGRLDYISVTSGETQVVAGTNYRLVIEAKDGGGVARQYEAVVWEKPWEGFRQLTSFKIKG